MNKRVKCPSCGKQIEWSPEQKWRPFCSDRCRLIDLGDWANESHRIPGEEIIPEEQFSDKEE
ncbi:MAG: DNA gyrase inhibitor YacG [Gammaproteobacteria bacterium]|nr:DNA gyrase inhibitor YacG [Gammaproteobacteria bacterium]